MLQRWIVYDNGVEIHRLQATKEFMDSYGFHTGYTYELDITPEDTPAAPEPSVDEILDTLLGVKTDEQTANG